MIKRTTIDIDQDLLARAKKALGAPTARAAVETALRIATEDREKLAGERREAQRRFLRHLGDWADLSVLASEEMWR